MSIVKSLVGMLWGLVKIVLVPVVFIVGIVAIILMIWFIVYVARGYRPKKGEHNIIRRPPLWKNLLYLAPVRYILDYFDRDPEFFTHQGCIVYTGRQGSGKTIAMIEQAMLWQKEYPNCKTITNLAYEKQDDELRDWRQLITYNNGIRGVVVLIDEMQNWFSSNQSKNFPPEMLEIITQNRKNRRVIMGTAQSFNRLAKPIREQATEVRKCKTFFGCITFVHRVTPEINSAGEVERWIHKGWYYFVHTDEIRDSYDTYRVIKSLEESGFQEVSNLRYLT